MRRQSPIQTLIIHVEWTAVSRARALRPAWGSGARHSLCALTLAASGAFAWSQDAASTAAPGVVSSVAPGVVLDRVVAVVNNQAILASDVNEEIRLSILDPGAASAVDTPAHALDELISRALIQQQIRQEDEEAAEPSQAEVDARLMDIRKELPACVQQNCTTDAGWKRFLSEHSLDLARVASYLRNRIEVLRFIEQRFRQGIQVTPEEIEAYYRNTLVPSYTAGTVAPALNTVASRIGEILLEQRVNVLFEDWLKNLRNQGEIEVLDPALETPGLQAGPGEGSK